MPFFKNSSSLTKHFSRPMLPTILLACSIALTIIAWHTSRNHLNEKTRDRFDYKVNAIHAAIRVRMSAYEQVLRSAVGLFYAADTITRAEWKHYVQTLRLNEHYPGILGIGYTVKLSPADVQPFTRKVRAEGYRDFTVWPEAPRDEYFAIVYLEPFEGRNLRAFGFDMYIEPNRKEAMLRARQTGEPALSDMVILVQETNKDVQKGCLMYLPVYNQKMKLATAEERHAALKGFVYSAFRINDLMNGILGLGAEDIEFEIYDGRTVDTTHLFYTSHGYNNHKNKADFSSSRTLQVAGHDWTLVFTTREPFVSSYEANQPNAIAVAGILVNLFLLYILLKINSLSKRNRILAERYKEEKDRYEIVAESTNEIIWEWNVIKDVISFNKNFHLVTGSRLPASEVPFQLWIDYVHPGDKDRVTTKLRSLLTDDQNLWSDEFRLMKVDGSAIYILGTGRLIHDAAGKPVRMVGSMLNITERKEAEKAQLRFNEELEKTVQARTSELQRSNEELERFAHVTSHDLREPVRKMLLSIDQLRTRYQDVIGDGVVLLNRLTKSANRLNEMIESILTFSTVNYESHKAEAVDLEVVIQNVSDDLELIINQKHAQINHDPLPVIEGSAVLLHQLFYNLINNSLKFSKTGVPPVVKIQTQTLQTGSGEIVEIKVSDNGIGFSPKEADNIFQSFVRLHSKDRYEGTGLGLALCKRIVERHGGTIEAVGSLTEGALFTIRLPKQRPAGII